jgi:hypothetical protein
MGSVPLRQIVNLGAIKLVDHRKLHSRIPVPYEIHYCCRGDGLFKFNCQEYYALVGIKEKPPKKKTGTDNSMMDIRDNKVAKPIKVHP